MCALWMPRLSADENNEAALRELLRGSDGVVKHWTHAPDLVVLDSVMMYQTGEVNSYTATSKQLTTEEDDELVSDLTAALQLLTGNTFLRFATVRHESVGAGTDTRVLRPGQIVAGRYRDLQNLMHTIGLGGRASRADGRIISAAIILDDEFDRESSHRRLLRMHELGHALGYNHVQSRVSIMNPTLGPEPTAFDLEAARVAFHAPVVSSN
jgi:hypothetical protein